MVISVSLADFSGETEDQTFEWMESEVMGFQGAGVRNQLRPGSPSLAVSWALFPRYLISSFCIILNYKHGAYLLWKKSKRYRSIESKIWKLLKPFPCSCSLWNNQGEQVLLGSFLFSDKPWLCTSMFCVGLPICPQRLAYEWVLVTQSCLSLCDPMDYSQPGSSVHRIFQARTLEWVAIPFSRGSSRPRDWTLVSCIAGRFFTLWATIHLY